MVQIPATRYRFDHIARSPAYVNASRGLALYRGDSCSFTFQILDTQGNPFVLGTAGNPLWIVRAQTRSDLAQNAGSLQLDFAGAVIDAPSGLVSYSAAPAQSAGILDDELPWDLEIENVADPDHAVGATYTIREGRMKFYGDVARETSLLPVDEVEGPSVAATLTGESLRTANPYAPSEGEVDVFVDVVNGHIRLRSISGQQGLTAEIVGNSIRIKRRPRLWAPSSRSRDERYKRIVRVGRRTAGAVAILNPGLVDNHQNTGVSGGNNTPTKWGFPYVDWTAIDFYGYPHNDHRRIRGTSLASGFIPSGRRIVGYEYGHEIQRGDFVLGRKLVWELAGKKENVGYANGFEDWCLDLNPDCTAGTYRTTHRMRMGSGERGWIWTGEAYFRAHIELQCLGYRKHAYFGEFWLYDPAGGLLDHWWAGDNVDSGYDFVSGTGATAYLVDGVQSTGTATLLVKTGLSTIEKGAEIVVTLGGIDYTAPLTADYVGGAGTIALGTWSKSGVSIADNTPVSVRRETATVQLRWRVDRDVATRLDTFDDTYQGANQGSNLHRLHVESYDLQFVGFEDR